MTDQNLNLKEGIGLNDKRNLDIEEQPNKLYNAHCLITDMVTLTHYVDNVVKGKETVLADLIAPNEKMVQGIKNYIYVHEGTIGALVYVNGFFQAHIYHGEKPKGDQYLYHLGGHPEDKDFFQGEQLVHYIDFHLDDDESKMSHIYVVPGLLEKIEEELKKVDNPDIQDAADSYVIDGLTPAIHAIAALISDKEVEDTFNEALRIKRIDPFLTLVYEEDGVINKEKFKMSLDAFAIPEDKSRYVINVSLLNLNTLLMFNRLLFKQLPVDDPNSEGMLRVYDAKMIRLLAENSPHSYVLGIIETSNGNFNVNYDAGRYVGYSFKQSFNSKISYLVVMNKEDPALGYEAIIITYDDFGQSFMQPLSKENADIVFKNLIAIRPNLHEDYIDSREIKDVKQARGESSVLIHIDEGPFMKPIDDLEDD